jgi:hypothetical protein
MADVPSGETLHQPTPQSGDADYNDLLDQVESDVVGWRPEPGDTIVGILVDITEGEGDWGPYPLLSIKTLDGELVGIHCFHTVLKKEVTRKIDREQMKIGDKIAVAYRGEGTAKGGNNAPQMYRIAVKRV